MFCEVAIPLPVKNTFTYRVPQGVSVRPGMRVKVPFGRRGLEGVVTSMSETTSLKRVKELSVVQDVEPAVSASMLKFTKWMADYYMAGWGEVLSMATPPAARGRREIWLESDQARNLEILSAELKPSQEKSKQALLRLAAEGAVRKRDLLSAGLTPLVLKRAELEGLLKITERLPPATQAPLKVSAPPQLLPGQKKVVDTLVEAVGEGKGGGFLLHGVTGSGKTEIYLRVIDDCMARGQGAIVLVPEIALTPQTWSRFEARFPGRVAVLHSGLSDGDREMSFDRLRRGEAMVALGARSALFAPVINLGVIVVDEESEPSYKQENSPRYHARDAALVRAKQENAIALLGSATPSFESWANVRSGKLELLSLPARASGNAMPEVAFLDLRENSEEGSRDDALSPALVEHVRAAAARGEQSLLFLNRRGFAPVLSCARCGESVQCPHCSISLTLHQERADNRQETGAGWLRCHLCGHAQRPPLRCEAGKCPGALLRAVGSGTQRLEQEVKRRLPGLRVERVDRDTAGRAGYHNQLNARVHAGEIDVLVGTQMLAKGHDFPELTQVGVINADMSLNFPDFRATERTFQLLVQVAGRAGRADKPGKVWVQTRQPGHPCLLAAAAQDFEAFFDAEIDERRMLGYPPYGRLAAVLVRSMDKVKALKAADALSVELRRRAQVLGLKGVEVMGPAAAPLIQIKQWWRYRLLIKASSVSARASLLEEVAWQAAPAGVQWAFDIDPLQFM